MSAVMSSEQVLDRVQSSSSELQALKSSNFLVMDH